MKKLTFMFVAVAAFAFASCGGNKANNANEEVMLEEVVPVEVVEIQAENDSIAAQEVLEDGEQGEIVEVEEVAE